MQFDPFTAVGLLRSAAQLEASERMAKALVQAEVVCSEADHPLSERQRATLITSALLSFDGLAQSLQEAHEAGALLDQLRTFFAEHKDDAAHADGLVERIGEWVNGGPGTPTTRRGHVSNGSRRDESAVA